MSLPDSNNQSLLDILKSIIHKDVDSQRISVPLFLLAPVSLLEDLSWSFDPELFASIPKQPTAVERGLSVLRLYLRGLAKSFKPSKKPFNPILGETFNCNWGNVRLEAEQVEHHPPISAFWGYAKGVESVLISNLKGKFNGVGFTVLNESSARIRVKASEEIEEWICTYPNGYVNGLFTAKFSVVWSGASSVECKEKGVRIEIVFHEKVSFIETLEMEAKVYENEVLVCTVSGKWTEEMWLSWTANAEKQPFMDNRSVCQLKRELPAEPLATDSFVVWNKVFEAMNAGNSKNASQLKVSIEEEQRKQAREREQNGTEYKPLRFRKVGDAEDWIPLEWKLQ